MTDNGLMLRGYQRYPVEENEMDTVDSRFIKPFCDEKGNELYALVITKLRMYMDAFAKYNRKDGSVSREDRLMGPFYEYEVLMHDKNKRNCIVTVSFSSDWTIDDVENRVKALYDTGLFVGY